MTKQEKEELAHYAGNGILEFGALNDLDPGVRSLLINTYDLNIMSGYEIKDHPFESAKKLLEIVRKTELSDKETNYKVENCRAGLIDLFFLTYETEKYFSLMEPKDKDWLLPITCKESGLRKKALTILLVGMNNRYETFEENIIAEDTGEPDVVSYSLKIDGVILDSTPDEQQELLELLEKEDNWESYSEEEKLQAYRLLHNHTDLDTINLLLLFAEDYQMKKANEELGFLYCYGEEEHGIFIDRKKAKKYFDQAGVEFDPNEIEDDEDLPSGYDYTIKGNADTINGIKTMIYDLCRDYGTPDNEFGLFVPLEVVMKLLVGTAAYRGNIISMEGPLPISVSPREACLTIHIEADNGYPLLYALRQCFENLDVEMKETAS